MNNNDHKNLIDIGFFKNGDHFVFALKKSERIVQALYLVTQHIKDTDPIKLEIREYAISLVGASFSLNSIEPEDQNALLVSFFAYLLKISSLLHIAFGARLINISHNQILQNEIDMLISYVKNSVFKDNFHAGFILSKDFFATDNAIDKSAESNKGQRDRLLIKKTRIEAENAQIPKENGQNSLQDKKISRQESIINYLKKESKVTIKDFLKVIHNCSEKTIQRELIELVNKGIIKKEGERRWSRYSLI